MTRRERLEEYRALHDRVTRMLAAIEPKFPHTGEVAARERFALRTLLFEIATAHQIALERNS